jgi:serine/threonine protein kinase
MDSEILGHLFVSYSHADKSHMLVFRKHLKGMLLNKVQIWSDQEISKGTEWKSFLKDNLNQASSAVVLATPDYLISPWCRHELKQLAAARRSRRLRNVFWVQLKPCGWQHTELAEFQSFENSVEVAITELPDETQRQRAILQACEHIASEIVRSTTEQDRHLAFVRQLLLDAQDGHDITLNEILHVGAFSIVCQGFSGSINAAIKVLRRTPLERMTKDFLRIGKQRMKLGDPSFIRIHNIFQVGAEEERRTIIVSDYVSNTTLLSTILDKEGPVLVDKAALLLHRTAEGLAELHKLPGAAVSQDKPHRGSEDVWERTLGLLTPDDLYYDQAAERLRMPPIGVSNFLWHVLDCATYEDWVDPTSKVYVAPEQRKTPGEHLTPKTDQYMLGRLGVELLEGLRLEQILKEKSATVEQFWQDPEGFIDRPWRNNHRQLWSILKRMLQAEPSKRYHSMDEVVHRLRVLEEEGRALAKRVYFPPPDTKVDDTLQLKGNVKFFKQFYETFFRASPDSKKKFKSLDQEEQHSKLMMSMAAVLNFRQGNEPTSLDHILDKHRGKGITELEFKKFRESFLATMDSFTNSDQELRKAWDDLFTPVIDYMISACVEPPSAREERGAGDSDGATAHELPGDKPDVEKKTRRRKTR